VHGRIDHRRHDAVRGPADGSILDGTTFAARLVAHSTILVKELVCQPPSATSTTADGQVQLDGEITLKGIVKPIQLTGTIAENGEDPWGNQRIGLELETVIDRRDFDLKWNQTLPNGNLLVANEVKLLVSVSAVKSA
jgi:hypothetical protein